MRNKMLAMLAGTAMTVIMLAPEPASARIGGFGGFRGGGFGGFRGAAIGGWRGGAIGWRGAGWRPGWGGWGWRRGWGWGVGAAAVGAGIIAASSYPYYGGYGYDPYDTGYYGAYGYGGGCALTPRAVWTGWGYQQVLVRVCY